LNKSTPETILKIWLENSAGTTSESKPNYKCRYCERTFAKESTLAAHQCESKRRWQQEKEVGVQIGFQSYLRFYELTQGSTKSKTYADFAVSSYYTAFVRFGRYMVDVRAVNARDYCNWLLKNNKKLDQWCRDSYYSEWLADYIRREPVQDALERALKEMQNYADHHPELKNGFNDYFRYGNTNRVIHHISTGRISPWVCYNCTSGIEFLEQLSADQSELILPQIDPAYWFDRFHHYAADVDWVKEILQAAGL